MMASLRRAAHVRSLVVRTTELGPGDENFDTAIEYVNVNLEHHRFADMGADGIACRPLYEELIAKLERHAQHSKADALRALCSEVCLPHSGGVPAWEWSSRHPKVEHGISALVALYWLSNTAQMVRTREPTQLLEADGIPSAIARIRAAVSREKVEAAARRAAWHGHGAEAAEVARWGYSDDDEANEHDEHDEHDEADEAGEDALSSIDTSSHASRRSRAPLEPPCTSASGRRARAANLGTPPPQLHLELLGGGGGSGRAGDGAGGSIGAAERACRLGELRLLREALRALSTHEGVQWCASGGGAGSSRVALSASARDAWLQQAAVMPPAGGLRSAEMGIDGARVGASASCGAHLGADAPGRLRLASSAEVRTLLHRQPTATRAVLATLEEYANRILGVQVWPQPLTPTLNPSPLTPAPRPSPQPFAPHPNPHAHH